MRLVAVLMTLPLETEHQTVMRSSDDIVRAGLRSSRNVYMRYCFDHDFSTVETLLIQQAWIAR